MNHKGDGCNSKKSNSSTNPSQNSRMGFGPHFMMDCYGSPRKFLNDLTRIYKTLDTLPEMINMTKIMPPYVFKYVGLIPEDWGLSGFVLIAESHISIHTFPEKRFMALDIFSCKPFEPGAALEMLQDYFRYKKSEINNVDRGRSFPHYSGDEAVRKAENLTYLERTDTRGRLEKKILSK